MSNITSITNFSIRCIKRESKESKVIQYFQIRKMKDKTSNEVTSMEMRKMKGMYKETGVERTQRNSAILTHARFK